MRLSVGAPFRFGHFGVSGIPTIEEMSRKTFSGASKAGDTKQIPKKRKTSAVCSKQFPPSRLEKRISIQSGGLEGEVRRLGPQIGLAKIYRLVCACFLVELRVLKGLFKFPANKTKLISTLPFD